MALSYITQQVCAGGGEEFLFRLDALLTGRGYTRLGSRTTPWPATYAGLASDEYVAWRNPSSALSRWELQADMTNGTPDSITLISTPVTSEPCWDGRNSWNANASNAASTITVHETDFRMSITADDNSIFGWVEWAATDKGFYVGRAATPLETAAVDPHPEFQWAGTLDLATFCAGWKKIYAGDATTQLTAGALLTLGFYGDAAKNPTAATKGQTTLSSANWHWETPIVAFDESAGTLRERVGRPDGIYVRSDTGSPAVWGADGEWACVNGVVFRWSPGAAIAAAYP